MEVILRIVEHPRSTAAMLLGGAMVATRRPKEGLIMSGALAVGTLGVFCGAMIYGSRKTASKQKPAQVADWGKYFESEYLAKYYKQGRLIPMVVFYEAYLAGKVTLKADMIEIMEKRHSLFTFTFVPSEHLKYFWNRLLPHLLKGHNQQADADEILPVYNLGNDFYSCFLGKTMIYTSGLFEKVEPGCKDIRKLESLESAQERKMRMVCESVHMYEDNVKTHLDIGCGWGALARFASKNYNVQSTGVALASEQIEWCQARAAEEGSSAKFVVTDYRDIPKGTKFDAITCLEMAEHVGIQKFQEFLTYVRNELLAENGIFYLQIAGLRRTWQYEDLVWGIFMDSYIFPGADASCPLGFVVSQLERAGYEVHRVENCGVHYAETIERWYYNFQDNRATAVAKYGGWQARLWDIFLSWSTMIARQGSSTVFMVTAHKNHENDARTHPNGPFSRARWIGTRKLATQQ